MNCVKLSLKTLKILHHACTTVAKITAFMTGKLNMQCSSPVHDSNVFVKCSLKITICIDIYIYKMSQLDSGLQSCKNFSLDDSTHELIGFINFC